jgi:hypothetical protein
MHSEQVSAVATVRSSTKKKPRSFLDDSSEFSDSSSTIQEVKDRSFVRLASANKEKPSGKELGSPEGKSSPPLVDEDLSVSEDESDNDEQRGTAVQYIVTNLPRLPLKKKSAASFLDDSSEYSDDSATIREISSKVKIDPLSPIKLPKTILSAKSLSIQRLEKNDGTSEEEESSGDDIKAPEPSKHRPLIVKKPSTRFLGDSFEASHSEHGVCREGKVIEDSKHKSAATTRKKGTGTDRESAEDIVVSPLRGCKHFLQKPCNGFLDESTQNSDGGGNRIEEMSIPRSPMIKKGSTRCLDESSSDDDCEETESIKVDEKLSSLTKKGSPRLSDESSDEDTSEEDVERQEVTAASPTKTKGAKKVSSGFLDDSSDDSPESSEEGEEDTSAKAKYASTVFKKKTPQFLDDSSEGSSEEEIKNKSSKNKTPKVKKGPSRRSQESSGEIEAAKKGKVSKREHSSKKGKKKENRKSRDPKENKESKEKPTKQKERSAMEGKSTYLIHGSSSSSGSSELSSIGYATEKTKKSSKQLDTAESSEVKQPQSKSKRPELQKAQSMECVSPTRKERPKLKKSLSVESIMKTGSRRGPRRPGLNLSKNVEFLTLDGGSNHETHHIESFKDHDLWYRRIECKRLRFECEAMEHLFREKRKDFGMAVAALYESFFKNGLSQSDTKMLMRYLGKNSLARGLEDRITGQGPTLRREHVKNVMGAQQRAALEDCEEDVSDLLSEASLATSAHSHYVAGKMAEFDEMEAKNAGLDSDSEYSIAKLVLLDSS